MRWAWSGDWRDFFGDEPYPFDLGCVEDRDGSERQCELLRSVFGPPPQMIVDLGCGYGRHIASLAKDGYQAVGIDVSLECVRRATGRPGDHHAIVARHERLPFGPSTFDGAYSVYSSAGYAGTSTWRLFAEAYRVIRPGGRLVIDVGHAPRMALSCGWEKVSGGAAVWVKVSGCKWIRQHNFVGSSTVSGKYGFRLERHTVSSLRRHAAEASWTVCEIFGSYDQSTVHRDSPRLVLVACRRS